MALLRSPDPGAECGGAVYRVAEEQREAVLELLDHREKGGYDRLSLEALLPDRGLTVTATTWIASPDNPYHLGPASLGVMVAQIRAAVGPSGRNVDYVLKLAETLRALGVDDPEVSALARLLEGDEA